MDTAWQDLKYGARTLARNPGFTAVAVLTLALGIGANTAIFSVVNSILLRPLPYRNPDRIVSIGSKWEGFEHSSVSIPEYVDYRRQARSLEALAAYHGTSVNLAVGAGEPERVQGANVTPSLFPVLGREAARGRTFLPEEGLPGNHRVVVLSHGLWQRRFGGDEKIVGGTLRFDNQSYSVAGVMPPDFYFPDKETELWLSLPVDPEKPGHRGAHTRQVIARLKPGVSLAQAQAEMTTIARRLQQDYPIFYPEGSGWGLSVASLHERVVGDVRPALLVLLAAVGLVLLIACANVANLLLARGAARRTEIAIRAALGAPRRRLARQLLTESVPLALLGGAVGLLLAWWGVDILKGLGPADIPRLDEVGVDPRVLSFALGLSLLTSALFGLVPALRVSHAEPHGSLREGSRRLAGGGAGRRIRSSLVVTEIALALVLLVGAGLLVRSFSRLLLVEPGLNPDNVQTARITLSPGKYSEDEQQVAFYRDLLAQLRAQPGVLSAGAISLLPFGGSYNDWSFGIEGYEPAAPGLEPDEQARVVCPGYFRSLEIPLRRGRWFEDSDVGGSPPVVIISEALAQKYWGEVDPLGKRIKLWSLQAEGPWWTVVGIVGDVKHFGLAAEAKPIIYFPHAQFPQGTLTVVVRTAGGALAAPGLIRRAVRSLDREQPIFAAKPMEQYVSNSLGQPRFNLFLLSLFAVLALALAAVGVYGVVAYAANQRTHEIGIRMALGAEPKSIFRLLLGEGMRLAFLGVLLGGAAALGLTRFLATLLFGVSPTDPATFAGLSLVLILVVLLACYIPARRATRLDPMVALRYE